MVMAMMYPESENSGRGKKKTAAESAGVFSDTRLKQARAVLRHSRSLAESVLDAVPGEWCEGPGQEE
jgi:hypothetical protein